MYKTSNDTSLLLELLTVLLLGSELEEVTNPYFIFENQYSCSHLTLTSYISQDKIDFEYGIYYSPTNG